MFQRSIKLLSLSLFLAAVMGTAYLQGQGLVTTATKDDWEEINFEFNSSVLTDGYPSLLRLAELLQQNPDYRVRLIGHTDWIGSSRYNDRLGLARANTVRDFLVKYGARPGQITAVSSGDREPKVGAQRRDRERTKHERWINRRVEMVVTDGQGRTVSAGGVGDAIRSFDELLKKQQECCDAILKRLDKLDEIAAMLRDLKAENDSLRKDVEDLRQAQAGLRQQVGDLPKPMTRPEVEDVTRTAAAQAIQQAQMPRFSLLGANVGADTFGNLTFQGRGQYFAPFRERMALQAQGEYMRWSDRLEGQFDFGLLSRFVPSAQIGLFASFRRVDLTGFQQGATLGQASFTLDHIFSRGRVGIFGAKGFMNEAVVGRTPINVNAFQEQYLSLVDQIGGSTSVGLYGNSWIEGNLGFLRSRVQNRAGFTLRFIQPISEHVAFNIEGGMNETFIINQNYGRVVAGFLFGNFFRPKDFKASPHPVPVEIPRIRYELLTRTVRTGNSPPVVIVQDQIGVPPGVVRLDASSSYDPDGDPITFSWTQVSGPGVAISGRNESIATFTAEEGQSYAFTVTVRDDRGAQAIGRVNVTTRQTPRARILTFTANPPTIRSGESSVLAWTVENADEVVISGIGSVDPRSGTRSVSPTQTTTYTLTARGPAGDVSQSVTVTVQDDRPRILNFQAQPANILSGESSTLSWSTQGATEVSISGVGSVAVSGNTVVSPTQTTTYTLTARGPGGETTASVTVQVMEGQAPRIIRFTASPLSIDQGQTSTLLWAVENATDVSITNIGAVDQVGTRDVQPQATTTYRLVARNPRGEATAEVTIEVKPVTPPTPPVTLTACVATPAVSARPGDPVTLSFNAQDAITVAISGIGNVPVTGPVTVAPSQTTTYTITATGAESSATCQIAVQVTPAPAPTAAIAGGPVITTLRRELTLDASGSTDPSGLPLTYFWEALGTRAAIVDQGQARTRVQLAGLSGDYPFRVTVTNSAGVSSTAEITVRFISTTIY